MSPHYVSEGNTEAQRGGGACTQGAGDTAGGLPAPCVVLPPSQHKLLRLFLMAKHGNKPKVHWQVNG